VHVDVDGRHHHAQPEMPVSSLASFSGDRGQVGIAVGVPAGLEPALELAVQQQERLLGRWSTTSAEPVRWPDRVGALCGVGMAPTKPTTPSRWTQPSPCRGGCEQQVERDVEVLGGASSRVGRSGRSGTSLHPGPPPQAPRSRTVRVAGTVKRHGRSRADRDPDPRTHVGFGGRRGSIVEEPDRASPAEEVGAVVRAGDAQRRAQLRPGPLPGRSAGALPGGRPHRLDAGNGLESPEEHGARTPLARGRPRWRTSARRRTGTRTGAQAAEHDRRCGRGAPMGMAGRVVDPRRPRPRRSDQRPRSPQTRSLFSSSVPTSAGGARAANGEGGRPGRSRSGEGRRRTGGGPPDGASPRPATSPGSTVGRARPADLERLAPAR
jgi:hypothetical protein